MIKYYLKYRLKGLQFFVLAALFYFLIIDVNETLFLASLKILFLFVSFIVFRFIDDAGSYVLDRENFEDRIYLFQPNFTKFIYLTITVSLMYLTWFLWFDFLIFSIVLGFLTASVSFYLLFGRNKIILAIIPLLKYPFLLWLLVDFKMDNHMIFIVLSSFFIMVSFELLEKNKSISPNLYQGLLFMLIAGLFLFQPWLDLTKLVIVIFPLIVALVFKRVKYLKYLPILYYPLIHLIIVLL